MDGDTELDPDRAFALLHVPVRSRPAVAALWRLDMLLGRFVARSREPMATQIRMTWWHATLTGLVTGERQHDPLLDALATLVMVREIAGNDLAVLVEGWEALLEPEPDAAALDEYANKRGRQLFALSARLIGQPTSDACGEGWALVDLSRRLGEAPVAAHAKALGAERLAADELATLPRALRVLARLANDDVRGRPRTRWSYWRAMR